jgi:hypothetical protein
LAHFDGQGGFLKELGVRRSDALDGSKRRAQMLLHRALCLGRIMRGYSRNSRYWRKIIASQVCCSFWHDVLRRPR